MKTREWLNVCLVLVLLAVISVQASATEEHVPEGITMQTEFKPGYGETLGLFKKTIGRVVLIHATDTSGYWAENDLPLYMKDTVVTPEEGLALLQFLDESTISVAEDSELTVNRFIFDPSKFDRSTFIKMKSGKARFWVKKLKGYTRSEFKVKTKTMVAGVRGTDFGMVIDPSTGIEDAFVLEGIIDIVPIGEPSKIIKVRAGQKVRVKAGQVLGVEKMSPAEVTKLKNELPMPFDEDVMDTAGIFKTEGDDDSEEKESQPPTQKETVPTDEVDVSPTPSAQAGTTPKVQPKEDIQQTEEAAAEVAVKEETVPTDEEETPVKDGAPILAVGPETVILIDEGDLATPVPVVELGGNTQPPDPFDIALPSNPGAEPNIYDVADGGSQAQVPAEVFVPPPITTLPGMPGTPIP